jgi:hypothetical protein
LAPNLPLRLSAFLRFVSMPALLPCGAPCPDGRDVTPDQYHLELRGRLRGFTPTLAELAFAEQQTRRPASHIALLVFLKTFQRLGYFVQLTAVPAAAHVV